MKKLIGLILATVALALAGCDSGESTRAGEPAQATWLLTSMPEGVEGVAAVKSRAAEGDQVVVLGVIGGIMEPVSAESPVFVIVDTELPSCADKPADHCPTPWDYCCETRESLTANNATVLMVDESGSALQVNLGDHGVVPLAEVVVVGEVLPRPNEGVLTIKATKLYKVGS